MKQSAMHRFVRSLPVAATAVTAMTCSTNSLACSTEPYIASMCVMAWPKSASFGNGMYVQANGATLTIQAYAALYSLIGITYGGNGTTNFALPNLSGRVVIGAGTNPDTGLVYNYGQKGNGRVSLTPAQVPLAPHVHTLNAGANKLAVVTAGLGNLSATTTLAGLTATTSLSGVTASVNGSGLVLKASSGTAGTGTPTGAVLATPTGPANKIYAGAAPDVAMSASSISGTAPVTFTGNPTTTVSGNPTTTLAGAPAVALSGSTDSAGANASQAVDMLPPYLAMTYYIAVNGIYPSVN